MVAMMAKGEPRRLRVLFADELGRHVLRHRGFSACWFLVPRDARIVGDLAYALVKEFELAKRCPAGVDLTLDELQLPPNQDISIVRDNDAIVVQCALRSDLDAVNRYSGKRNSQAELICAPSSSSDEESEEEDDAKAREQLRLLAKKSKARLKKAAKRSDKRGVKGKRVVAKSQPVAAPADANPSISDNDSDSDSSSSSSGGSSSSSEPEASDALCVASDRSNTETRKQPGDQVRSTEPSAPALPSRPAATTPAASNGQRQPRQRRRQRRRRRDRHRGAEDEVATEDKGQPSTSVHEPESRTVGPVADAVPPRCEVAVSKRYSRSKGHLRFDDALNEQIVDAQVEVVDDPTGVSGHRQVSPDLEKYGPSSTGKRSHNHENGEQASAHGRGNRGYRDQDAAIHHDGHGDTDGFVPRRKKARREELWRRPYEVVATVLDKPAKGSSTVVDMTKLLEKYPSPALSPVDESCFHQDDIIAFKTLSLCLETWQPVLSEWQCGKILAVDTSDGVTVSTLPLDIDKDSKELSIGVDEGVVDSETESKVVSLSDFNAVRYLRGPSFDAASTNTSDVGTCANDPTLVE